RGKRRRWPNRSPRKAARPPRGALERDSRVDSGMPKSSLTPEQRRELLETLQARFESHPKRHPGIGWSQVLARLQADAGKIWSLSEMERTGGEPDAVALGQTPEELIYCDCSAESPSGRRSLCYDPTSLASRKSFKPAGSALGLAA